MGENIFIKVKASLAAIAGMFFAAFGWLGLLVTAWVALMLGDYITGSAAAIKNGEWSSKLAREGIWHKAGMIAVVAVSALTDGVLGTVLGNLPGLSMPLKYTVLICPLVICWYLLTEAGSVLENAHAMGANVPEFLVKILANAKKAASAAGDKAAEAADKNDR